MALKYIRSFHETVSAGGYAEIEWTPDEAVKIHRLLITERNGASLNNVQVYLSTPSMTITRDYAPALYFTNEFQRNQPIDLDVPAGAKIYMKITNNTASAIDVDVIFECVY